MRRAMRGSGGAPPPAPVPVLREVEAGREAWAVAENHKRASLALSPAHRCLERGQKCLADRIALVRPVQPEPSDAVTQFIGNIAFGT